jgi:hypothetical protein
MADRMIVGILAVVALLAGAPAALAQPLELKAPPSSPRSRRRPGRSSAIFARCSPPHEPAYVPGLSGETDHGTRYGVSGWTAPNPPVGSRGAANPESSGSAGFGFPVEWF